jgi:hypothetical protein
MRRLLIAILTTAGMGAFAANGLEPMLEEAARLAAAGQAAEAAAVLRQAEVEVWSGSPIVVTHGSLVSQEAQGYGVFQERPDNRFRVGEPILIYAEPAGYSFVREQDDYIFGFSADFTVLDENENVLGAQRNIQSWSYRSRHPLFEVYVNLTYSLSGAVQGKYIIETTFTDANGGGQGGFRIPIEIVE